MTEIGCLRCGAELRTDNDGDYCTDCWPDANAVPGWRLRQLRLALRVTRQTFWMGNGFGTETVWTARWNSELIGEWRAGSVGNWAGDRRGISVMSKADWRRAVDDVAARRISARK